jgi:cytochrome P450
MAASSSVLDPQRIRTLFDLHSDVYADRGGSYDTDPYPAFGRLRETGPVHRGIVGPLVGFHDHARFQGLPYPELEHFSVFDFETCDEVMRDTTRFISAPPVESWETGLGARNMLLYMDGQRHRRYRALVQPSFVPRRAQWWVQNWISSTVQALIDTFAGNGKADLNVEFCAAIPLLTICGSFGVQHAEALDIREAVTTPGGGGVQKFLQLVMPIISARRQSPQDDLISVLVQAEVTDEDDGERHVLRDDEILGFAYLLLTAGSGTTWKQMGITLYYLLNHPEWLERVRDDRSLLRPAIEEGLRLQPTDPMFSRYTAADTTLAGVDIPATSVVHLCFGGANRDPRRWDRPDEFDPGRPVQSHYGFGRGPHLCLGIHVARAEMHAGVSALLDRLPNLRLDPDAEPPRIIGMYERGATALPVVWG